MGLVGLPNVGKSTLFNILTNSQVAAENFPFCTIDPNESRVPVPDKRFDFLCEYFKPLSKVPAFLNVVDIAGLVKGANEGQGLGNAFLSHIRACDAIFHLCRCFEDEDVSHVEGDINPVRDIEIINEELRLKDEEYLTQLVDKLERTVVRGNDKKSKPEYDILCKIKHLICEEKRHVRFADWNAAEKGTKAPQAAGRIHTDFEKGFIMAEVMKFDDFKEEGSEAALKASGKYRQQGRNYVVEDGDIIFFKFNAGAGLQAKKK
ncbi:obg-like ATPase 1 [Trichonephila clavata]|uniref:Obg-like ATPase 1 n=1 Tax=Trichonephila clavata TaxID=2740835 RepID=A0A8X6G059_TRICU|nr:obg-like ATPase 1 [Trichonephila clavata]